jgi:hypothetical protein
VLWTNDSSGEYAQASALVPCSIDARWAAARVHYEPLNSSFVTSNISDSLANLEYFHNVQKFKAEYRLSDKPLDLALDWAALLDFNFADEDDGKPIDLSTVDALLNIPVSKLGEANNNFTTFQVPNMTSNDLNGAIQETMS